MNRKQSGYIVIVLFLLMSTLFCIGTIILYQSVNYYHVAQYQYQYYQKKFLLEGLLNHAINLVAADFEHYYKQNETEQVFVPWGNIRTLPYDGKIKTYVIESKEGFYIGITAEIIHNTETNASSCVLVKNEKIFYIDRWKSI